MHFVLPRLPEFLAEYPEIEICMSEGDRLVDLVREGIDCVLRVGDLQDSDMIARRVAILEEVTCAAPSYLDRVGIPASVDALEGHSMVGFHSSGTGALLPFEFTVDGSLRKVALPATASVNAAESFVAAARLGLGLIQVPALSRRRRFKARHAHSCACELSAIGDAGVAALSAQPPAVTTRSRLHRLAGGIRLALRAPDIDSIPSYL
jgi:DNA-binding transcriptional LysR family regulator